MTQLFRSKANFIFRISITAGILLIACLFLILVLFPWTPTQTRTNHYVHQDIPFSHAHHAGEIGIDCRFCHNFVEQSSYAGMPQTQICMKCHRVLFKDAPMLAPVHKSYETGEPIVWKRVYLLADFVFFDHSIHIHKDVQCRTCHGAVDQMPLMRKEHAMHMSWCLDCHRNAKAYIGDTVNSRSLLDCYTCHR